MAKRCRVLINNDAVTVFDYDGIKVQIPSIKKNVAYINVVSKNGRYIVVDDNYVEPVEKNLEKPKKRANKKTTTKESVNTNELNKNDKINIDA